MKKIIASFLFLLCLSCNNDDANDGKLTNLNYDGTGGISCKVNGAVLKPRGGGMSGNVHFDLEQDFENSNSYIRIGFSHKGNAYDDFKSVDVIGSGIDIHNLVPQTFDLAAVESASGYGRYFNNNLESNEFYTTDIERGELKLLHYESQRRIVTGTFWFDAINSNGEVVNVTDGRFDIRF